MQMDRLKHKVFRPWRESERVDGLAWRGQSQMCDDGSSRRRIERGTALASFWSRPLAGWGARRDAERLDPDG